MPWYKAGTVSVVQNSNAVIGTNTAFIANARVGDAFRGPDGAWYEVTNIASDTALSISPNYQGTTNATGTYALAPMQGYVKDSADALRALVNQFGGVLAVLGTTATTDGVRAALNLSTADGLPEGVTNKYMTGNGVRSTLLTGLVSGDATPVSATDPILAAFGKLQAQASQNATAAANAAKQGVGKGYIEGLRMKWLSANSILVSTGMASIPATGVPLAVSSAITITGLTLTASTIYHVYLYSNAGVPAVEVVTTAPVVYFGTARAKTGDNTRRYVGSVLSSVANTLWRFTHKSANRISYHTDPNSAPFKVVSGAVDSPQTVNCAPITPVSATHLACFVNNLASGTVARVGNPDMITGLSAGFFDFYVYPKSSFTTDIELSDALTFQWVHDGAADSVFIVYANGYLFER